MHENSVHVHDVDRDGWPDVIAGGWNEDGIYWYRNPGRSAEERGEPWRMHEAWQAKLLARTRGHMEMFALHDFDGDGVPELHSACYRKQEPLEVFRFATERGRRADAAALRAGGAGRRPRLRVRGRERRRARGRADRGRLVRAPAGRSLRRALAASPRDGAAAPELSIRREGSRRRRPARHPLRPRPRLRPLLVAAAGAEGRRHHRLEAARDRRVLVAGARRSRSPTSTATAAEELVAGKCIWAHEGGDPGAAEPPAVYYYKWDRGSRRFTRHTIAAPGGGRGARPAVQRRGPRPQTVERTSSRRASWGSGCS